MTALFIIGASAGLVWLDVQLRRVREELARERAARRKAVEAARAEGFLRGASLCPLASSGGQVSESFAPAGAMGGAR
jgi:hypothetical protein